MDICVYEYIYIYIGERDTVGYVHISRPISVCIYTYLHLYTYICVYAHTDRAFWGFCQAFRITWRLRSGIGPYLHQNPGIATFLPFACFRNPSLAVAPVTSQRNLRKAQGRIANGP